MPKYKVTYFFNSGVCGWSESYCNDAPNDQAALVAADSLAKIRMVLCGSDIDMPYIRVSNMDIRGDAILGPGKGYTTEVGKAGLTYIRPAYPTLKADVAWTAVQFKFSKDDIVVGRTYARGMPDDFFTSDRVFVPRLNWINAFTKFSQDIANPANGWCVYRKPKSTPTNTFKIKTATAVAGADLTITVPAGFTTAAPAPVRISGLKSDLGTLNGTFNMIAHVGNTLTIEKVFNDPVPTFVAGSGKIQSATPAPLSSLAVDWMRNATTRKAGRPFGAPVGRRKKATQLR